MRKVRYIIQNTVFYCENNIIQIFPILEKVGNEKWEILCEKK